MQTPSFRAMPRAEMCLRCQVPETLSLEALRGMGPQPDDALQVYGSTYGAGQERDREQNKNPGRST